MALAEKSRGDDYRYGERRNVLAIKTGLSGGSSVAGSPRRVDTPLIVIELLILIPSGALHDSCADC